MSQRKYRNYKPGFGNNVSHAKNRTSKTWKMNLQWARVEIGGTIKRVKISTRDLRTLAKQS